MPPAITLPRLERSDYRPNKIPLTIKGERERREYRRSEVVQGFFDKNPAVGDAPGLHTPEKPHPTTRFTPKTPHAPPTNPDTPRHATTKPFPGPKTASRGTYANSVNLATRRTPGDLAHDAPGFTRPTASFPAAGHTQRCLPHPRPAAPHPAVSSDGSGPTRDAKSSRHQCPPSRCRPS